MSELPRCWTCTLPPQFVGDGTALICRPCRAFINSPVIKTVSVEQSRADRDQRGPGSSAP